MGRKGREILEIDAQPIVRALTAAYADEWLAHYYYLHMAQVMTGLHAPSVAGLLKTKAGEELLHAEQLGERIQELGGRIPPDWIELAKLANARSLYKLPKDSGDIKGFLKVVLAVERAAIDAYQRLSKATRHRDTVTHELAEELLADEVKDEEQVENLLDE